MYRHRFVLCLPSSRHHSRSVYRIPLVLPFPIHLSACPPSAPKHCIRGILVNLYDEYVVLPDACSCENHDTLGRPQQIQQLLQVVELGEHPSGAQDLSRKRGCNRLRGNRGTLVLLSLWHGCSLMAHPPSAREQLYSCKLLELKLYKKKHGFC